MTIKKETLEAREEISRKRVKEVINALSKYTHHVWFFNKGLMQRYPDARDPYEAVVSEVLLEVRKDRRLFHRILEAIGMGSHDMFPDVTIPRRHRPYDRLKLDIDYSREVPCWYVALQWLRENAILTKAGVSWWVPFDEETFEQLFGMVMSAVDRFDELTIGQKSVWAKLSQRAARLQRKGHTVR